MIRAYFNLKNLPFQKSISTQNVFKYSFFNEGTSRLDYIKNNRGFMLLTGDPGSGKTTLLRTYKDSLNTGLYNVFYIPLATVSILDFYRQLNFYLNGTKLFRKSALFISIQEGIKTLVKNRKKVPIIIFDECHLLKNENFYELQIIFNFDFDSVNPAIVILAGQSHLRDRLSREVLNSFRQRISINHHVAPLSKDNLKEYIKHSLKIVNGSEDLFSESAIEAIFNHAQGNLRETNNISIKSLFAAAYDKKSQVTEEEVYKASKEV